MLVKTKIAMVKLVFTVMDNTEIETAETVETKTSSAAHAFTVAAEGKYFTLSSCIIINVNSMVLYKFKQRRTSLMFLFTHVTFSITNILENQ